MRKESLERLEHVCWEEQHNRCPKRIVEAMHQSVATKGDSEQEGTELERLALLAPGVLLAPLQDGRWAVYRSRTQGKWHGATAAEAIEKAERTTEGEQDEQ